MHTQVTQRFTLVLLSLLGSFPLHAQHGEDWRAKAISGVMHYRAVVLGDTAARFDECRVARHLDGTGPVAPRIAEPVRWMLQSCDTPGDRYNVRVDSLVRRSEGEVMLYVTVVRGEWVHREDYAMVPHDGPGPLMGVREVRLWGAVQSYPRRPTPGAAPD